MKCDTCAKNINGICMQELSHRYKQNVEGKEACKYYLELGVEMEIITRCL